MANNFLSHFRVDEYNHKYIEENRPKVGRFRHFNNVFLGSMNNMMITNLIIVLFTLPAIIWLVYCNLVDSSIGTLIPYSGNLGIGYPVAQNTTAIAASTAYTYAMRRAFVMLPLYIIGFVALGGGLNIIKYSVWGKRVKGFKAFFKGVKLSYLPAMWCGLGVGAVNILLNFSLHFFSLRGIHVAIEASAIAVSIILMVFMVCISMYVLTQATVYNLPVTAIFKNAFYLTINFIPLNLFFLLLSSVPVWLVIFLPSVANNFLLNSLFLVALVMLGYPYTLTIWTIFTHYVYDRLFTGLTSEERKSTAGNKSRKMSKKQLAKQTKSQYVKPDYKKK